MAKGISLTRKIAMAPWLGENANKIMISPTTGNGSPCCRKNAKAHPTVKLRVRICANATTAGDIHRRVRNQMVIV
ncbi:MAG: hypothetical protein Kow0031_08150 [Anaerolineae bacterium]